MGDWLYSGIKTVCLTVHFCVNKKWIKKIYFLEDENNTEIPNVEQEGDNPLSIVNNFYILYCLDYSQTIFCLFIASLHLLESLSKAEYCLDDSD